MKNKNKKKPKGQKPPGQERAQAAAALRQGGKTASASPSPLANQPADGAPSQTRPSLGAEVAGQFRTILETSVITLVLTSFMPERIKYMIRYGLHYAVDVTAGSPAVLAVSLLSGLFAYVGLRRSLSRAWRLPLIVGLWLLTVGGSEAIQRFYPIRGQEPTIGFFGFFRGSDDGSLRAAAEFDNVAGAFFGALAATRHEHPCSAKSILAFSRYDIHPFFLTVNSRSSLETHIRSHYIDAHIGIWAFVNASGTVEEFHVVPLVDDLFSDTTFFERAGEQVIRALNRDPSTRVAAARFGAKTLGALFGYAPATVLSEQEKDKDLPMVCAASSASMLEAARAFLAPLPGFEGEVVAHKAYWDPAFLVARAQAHETAGRHEVAAAVFAEAATLNPLFPYTSRADYLAALRRTGTREDLAGAKAEELMKKLKTTRDQVEAVLEYFRAQVPQPYGPALQTPVLVSVMQASRKSKGGRESIDASFSHISKAWPKECLIWLHWGEWYRDIMIVEAGLNRDTAPRSILHRTLFESLKPAMARYETAVAIDSGCAPARERLFEAYLLASQFDEPRQDEWLNKAQALMTGGVTGAKN